MDIASRLFTPVGFRSAIQSLAHRRLAATDGASSRHARFTVPLGDVRFARTVDQALGESVCDALRDGRYAIRAQCGNEAVIVTETVPKLVAVVERIAGAGTLAAEIVVRGVYGTHDERAERIAADLAAILCCADPTRA